MNEKDRLQMVQRVMLELKGIIPTPMAIEPNPCWSGYEPIGLKPDGSPNCVPIKENQSKVKEGFPIPSPSGETKDEFISKCMSEITGEYQQEQAIAICISKWEER